MPIVYHPFATPGAAMSPGYFEAKELARQCVEQYEFNIVPGPGGGIARGSCWAAVAVQPNVLAGFPVVGAVNPLALGAVLAPLPYTMVFGSSRMATIRNRVPVPGLGPVSNHAERNALLVAANNGLVLHPLAAAPGHGVMFVQLQPCVHCANWLNGPNNPYSAALAAGFTLHVWYRWSYPVGAGAMWAWNGRARAAKLANINAAW